MQVSLGGLEEMEHICQLTLSLFIEPILMNVFIWMIVVQFFSNFRRPPTLLHFSIWE